MLNPVTVTFPRSVNNKRGKKFHFCFPCFKTVNWPSARLNMKPPPQKKGTVGGLAQFEARPQKQQSHFQSPGFSHNVLYIPLSSSRPFYTHTHTPSWVICNPRFSTTWDFCNYDFPRKGVITGSILTKTDGFSNETTMTPQMHLTSNKNWHRELVNQLNKRSQKLIYTESCVTGQRRIWTDDDWLTFRWPQPRKWRDAFITYFFKKKKMQQFSFLIFEF